MIKLLWDVHAFFDSLELAKVDGAAGGLKFPPVPFALAMQAHTAERFISTWVGTLSKGIAPVARSILAGCTASTSLARAPMALAVASIEAEFSGETKHGQHVDDISQTITHESQQEAINLAIKAGALFSEEVGRLNLELSGKSVVIASSLQTAVRVKKTLKRKSVCLKAVSKAEFLGVGSANAGASGGGSKLPREHRLLDGWLKQVLAQGSSSTPAFFRRPPIMSRSLGLTPP